MPGLVCLGRAGTAVAALLVCALLHSAGAHQEQEQQQQEQAGEGAGDSSSSSSAAIAAAAAAVEDEPLPSLRVTAGAPAALGRYSYICSLRSAASSYSDSFCGCAVIAPRIVLTAGHCLDQDDPSLRLPRVEIGRYRRVEVITPLAGPPLTEADDGIARLRCERSFVHPGWSFATTRHDIALCYLDAVTDWAPVRLADEGSSPQRLAAAGEGAPPLAVIGWGTERAGAPEQAQVLQRAEVPLFDLAACNATFNGVLRPGQLCAGSRAAYGQLVADACQGDSGGPLVLEGEDGEDGGGGGGDTQVGIVSFGESCGILPGVYTDVAAYRRWIGETALAMAAEAGLGPEDVDQILPAAMAPAEAAGEERSVDQGGGGAGAGAAVRAALAAAQEARQQQQGAALLPATSVPAVSGAPSASDLAGALASMVLLPGGRDPCACVSPSSLAGAGGCRPMLGPAASEWGCFVSGGGACALATEVGGGMHARGCRPTPGELWSARAAGAGGAVVGAAGAAMRSAAAPSGSCAAPLPTPPPAAAGAMRLRGRRGAAAAATASWAAAAATASSAAALVVDPSKAGAAANRQVPNLPRVLAAAFRTGYAEAAAAANAAAGAAAADGRR